MDVNIWRIEKKWAWTRKGIMKKERKKIILLKQKETNLKQIKCYWRKIISNEGRIKNSGKKEMQKWTKKDSQKLKKKNNCNVEMWVYHW